METYELTQKLLSFGPEYEVRALSAHGAASEVIATIRGKLLSPSPKLAMTASGAEGEVATLTTNFTRTKFECKDARKSVVATLSFPIFALKKRFTLRVGQKEYEANGGFLGGKFECKDDAGKTVLVIAKQPSLRDKFAVSTSGTLPRDVALLAAVAIDQKFFQDA